MIYLNFLYFFLYALIGWICESTYISLGKRKLVLSGFLYGPYCPIYGFGAMFIIWVLSPYTPNPLVIYLMSCILTSVLEYFTSWLMEVLFHMRWWDYSAHHFNIKGRVCLLNSTLFGIMGLFLLYLVHPICADILKNIPESIQLISALTLFILMSIDTIISTIKVINLNKAINEIERIKDELRVQKALAKDDIDQKVQERIEYLSKRAYKTKKHLANQFPNITHHKIIDFKHLKTINQILKEIAQR